MGSAGGLWGAAVEAVGRGGGVILHLACVGWGGRKGRGLGGRASDAALRRSAWGPQPHPASCKKYLLSNPLQRGLPAPFINSYVSHTLC